MIIDFNWFNEDGVQKVISMIYSILDIIRIVVPIALIVMTSLDIAKKVINPSDKEGQQKILSRVIAAVIVFFIPTLVNLFFTITGIEISNVNVPSSNNKKSEIKEVELPNLKILNCPKSLTTFRNRDRLTLNTNINSDYNGDIVWSVTNGTRYVSAIPSSDKKSININFNNIFISDKVEVKVTAGGVNNICTIYVDKERLNNLSFTNCPIIRSESNKLYIGDSINLITDIPSDYGGEINWYSDNEDAVIIHKSNDKKSAKIDILEQPSLGYVIITAASGGQAKACLLNIYALKELKITNCPDSSNVYHIGDKITLNTNIPQYYTGVTTWGSSLDPNVAIATPIDNKRSAEIRIVGVPTNGYIHVAVSSDTDVKVDSCKINIQD